jgi:ABC-type multidrug transport system fused ATPase/permease subunit
MRPAASRPRTSRGCASFARERAQRERFGALSTRALEATLVANRVQARYGALMTLFPALGLFAVMLYGGNLALAEDGITDGTWVTFFAFLMLLPGSTRAPAR